jgi:hypothetical protein
VAEEVGGHGIGLVLFLFFWSFFVLFVLQLLLSWKSSQGLPIVRSCNA